MYTIHNSETTGNTEPILSACFTELHFVELGINHRLILAVHKEFHERSFLFYLFSTLTNCILTQIRKIHGKPIYWCLVLAKILS